MTHFSEGVSVAPVLSIAPIVLPAPWRAVDLQIRVSAPTTGNALPIILLSHGHGRSNDLSSFNGYAPLANFLAARGFVVIQPTHLDSTSLHLDTNDAEAPLYWRSRAKDMSFIIDRLDAIEIAFPELHGRLDRRKVGIVGHSLGGHTASLLLGAQLTDPHDGTNVDLADSRIIAGVLLSAPGRGGDALSAQAAQNYPFFRSTDFSKMMTAALVIAGDRDDGQHLTVRGAAWHADPYILAPGPKSLFTVFGGEHGLGGISGYDVAETTDESPNRRAAVAWLTCAYFRARLTGDEDAWRIAQNALSASAKPMGRIESK